MLALLMYHLKSYIKSSKFIMPMAIYVIFMVMMCGGTITSATTMFVISIVASYLFMVWSGFVYTESEDMISEQIAILKSGNNTRYYISKILFIIIWGVTYAILGIFIPFIWKLLCFLFKVGEFNHFTIKNIITAFMLHICVCILGATVGFIWHPRVMSNRKIAAIGAFSLGVMGLINGPLAEDLGVLRFVKWLFPPVYNILEKCALGVEKLQFTAAMIPSMLCIVYALILGGIAVVWLNRKGF